MSLEVYLSLNSLGSKWFQCCPECDGKGRHIKSAGLGFIGLSNICLNCDGLGFLFDEEYIKIIAYCLHLENLNNSDKWNWWLAKTYLRDFLHIRSCAFFDNICNDDEVEYNRSKKVFKWIKSKK